MIQGLLKITYITMGCHYEQTMCILRLIRGRGLTLQRENNRSHVEVLKKYTRRYCRISKRDGKEKIIEKATFANKPRGDC